MPQHDVDTRRGVLNAIVTGRDPHDLDLPEHVVSWHIIWLHHADLIELVDVRQYRPSTAGRHRAA